MSPQLETNGRAIIVLGMHRSGTSIVTRCIHLLGAEIAQQIIPNDATINRDGFFEDAHVVALNDELLSLLGSSWYDFRPLAHESADLQAITPWEKRALAHVQEEYAGKRLSVIKDPRMTRLWNYWAPIFKQAKLSVDFVHIARRPENVAISLNRRNEMPLVYGLLLWSAHIVDMLNMIDNKAPWTTLLYDSVLSDPHKNVKLIASVLGSDGLSTPDYAYIEGEIGVPPKSTWASTDDELSLIQDLRDFALQLYRSLENNCIDGKLLIAQDEIKRLNDGYQQLLSRFSVAFETLRFLTNELISLSGKLVKIGELHAQAQVVVAERDGQLAVLNRELIRAGADLEYAQSVVAERDEQLAQLNKELARVGAELGHAQSVIAEKDQSLNQPDKQLERVRAELRYAQSIVAEREDELAELHKELKRVGSEFGRAQQASVERNTQMADLNERITRYENVWFRRILRSMRRPSQ